MEYVVGFVNAKGAMPVVCLYDILSHVREVAMLVFVMVLPWHWLLRKLALAMSFDFFTMVSQPPNNLRIMSA